MLIMVLVLIFLSIFILKSTKEIPIVYAKKGKVEQTSILPIPLNPVGMIPIIFSIAFVTFPYLLGKVFVQINPSNLKLQRFANWVEANLNIYSQNPSGRVV
jgi:preprotein translocase subunit SecY